MRTSKSDTPVVLFCYKRHVLLAACLHALQTQSSPLTKLIIFIDGPKHLEDIPSVQKCIALAKAASTMMPQCDIEIIERQHNMGCRDNIRLGLDDVFQRYKTAIILEEDLLPSPFFYTSMCRMLSQFETEPSIASVSGYSFIRSNRFYYQLPLVVDALNTLDAHIYKSPLFSCWGWGTWQDQWQELSPRVAESPSLRILLRLPKRGSTFHSFCMYLTWYMGFTDSWMTPFQVHSILKHKQHIGLVKSMLRNNGFEGVNSLHTKSTEGDVNNHYDSLFELTQETDSQLEDVLRDIPIENDTLSSFLTLLKDKLKFKARQLLIKRELHLGRFYLRY